VINLSLTVKVYLCILRTDMRRGFDGLMRMAEEHLQKNVLQGGLFVFVNRHRDRVKLLYWNQDGLAIWYKRLERGTFALPQVDDKTVSVIPSTTELAMLLGGVDLKRVRKTNRYQIPA
jgi:transposase